MPELFHPEEIARSFGDASSRYQNFAEIQFDTIKELLQRITLLKDPPQKILDLGSGTGELTRQLKKQFPKATVIGVDLSLGMVAQSKKMNPWFRRSLYVSADSKALPFKENSFDLVVSNFMLHWCNDIDAIFMEVKRVLKDNAPVFMSALGNNTLKEMRDAWHAIDEMPHVHPFLDMHQLGDLILNRGFADPVLDCEQQCLYFQNPKDAIHSLKMIGAQNRLVMRRKTLTGKSRMHAFKNAYAEQRLALGYPLTYEVIYLHAWNSAVRKASQGGDHRYPIARLRENLKSSLVSK